MRWGAEFGGKTGGLTACTDQQIFFPRLQPANPKHIKTNATRDAKLKTTA